MGCREGAFYDCRPSSFLSCQDFIGAGGRWDTSPSNSPSPLWHPHLHRGLPGGLCCFWNAGGKGGGGRACQSISQSISQSINQSITLFIYLMGPKPTRFASQCLSVCQGGHSGVKNSQFARVFVPQYRNLVSVDVGVMFVYLTRFEQ